jgi:ParB family transcriptional regulator, chromosome partitioning protein
MPNLIDRQTKAAFKDAVRRTNRPAPLPTLKHGPTAGRRPDGSLFLLSLDRIQPQADQVRSRNKSASDKPVKEMAESIKALGIESPLLVRYRREQDIYEVVAGERRFTAAKLAGLQEVPVKVTEADERTVRKLQLHENIHRADLTPLELASALSKMLMDGETPESLATMLCKSQASVQKALTVAKQLSPAAKQLADAHPQFFTSLDLLYEVAQTPVKDQKALLEQVKELRLTREQVRQVTAPLKAAARSQQHAARGRKAKPRSCTRVISVQSGATVTVAFRKPTATDLELQRALEQAIKSVSRDHKKRPQRSA